MQGAGVSGGGGGGETLILVANESHKTFFIYKNRL